MTPENFKNDYLSTYGSGFSISPIFKQSAWFRFHNKSEDFRNLYFTGAGSHPGAGVPGVVSSAKIIENLILNETKWEKANTKISGKNFLFCFSISTKKIRKDIENLYIFCRFLDDLGDDQKLSKIESFKKLRKVKKQIKKKSTFPVVKNFIELMVKHKINENVPIELIKGIEYDLKREVNVKTFEELIKYCYRVAGTVGFMFCKIIKVKEKKLILGGIQLGIAMQLTNISRDVAEDLEMNRIYIPRSIRSYKNNDKEIILRNNDIKKTLSKDLLVLLKKADLFYENSWISIIN